VEDDMNERFSTGVMEDFIPGLQYVYKTRGFKEVEEFTHHVMEGFMRRKYKEAESTFNKGLYTKNLIHIYSDHFVNTLYGG
jgi:hypothetical protein